MRQRSGQGATGQKVRRKKPTSRSTYLLMCCSEWKDDSGEILTAQQQQGHLHQITRACGPLSMNFKATCSPVCRSNASTTNPNAPRLRSLTCVQQQGDKEKVRCTLAKAHLHAQSCFPYATTDESNCNELSELYAFCASARGGAVSSCKLSPELPGASTHADASSCTLKQALTNGRASPAFLSLPTGVRRLGAAPKSSRLHPFLLCAREAASR